MTGFGRGQTALGRGHITVELRTVNHKYQDIRLHLAPELSPFEHNVESILRKNFPRGRIELTAKLLGCGSTSVALDKELARQCLTDLEALRVEMGLVEPTSINVLAAVPEVFQQGTLLNRDDTAQALDDAVAQAIASTDQMRNHEGQALARDLDQRLDTIAGLVEQLRELAAGVPQRALERLEKRLAHLLDGRSDVVDESRIAQEAALIADRADVTEELIRLRSHIDHFRAISQEQGTVGKRLDFLLQEMNREASTTGAKAQDAEVQHIIVDLRGELNRIREQIQNIE